MQTEEGLFQNPAPTRRIRRGIVTFTLLVSMGGLPASAGGPAGSIRFEPNRGQADPVAAFVAHTPGGPLLLDGQGLRLGAAGLRLAGADPEAAWNGLDPLPGRAHYLSRGKSETRLVDISTFGAVVRRGVYPGVDLILRGSGSRLDLEFLVAPEADPGSIRLHVDGDLRLVSPRVNGRPSEWVATVEGVGLDAPRGPSHGLLRIEVGMDVPVPTVSAELPRLAADGQGHLVLAGRVEGETWTTFVSVLDPAGGQVSSTTYLDGFDLAGPIALAVAPSGDLVVAGAQAGDAALVRLDHSGREIVSRASFGGTGDDAALALAVDGEDNLWIAGRTTSIDLPVVAPAAQGAFGGDVDAFVARLDASGTWGFATYLGGPGADEARGIAVAPDGAVVLTGTTGADVLVAKIDPKAPSLVFSVPLGGTGEDEGVAIAVSESGEIVVAGTTRSPDFPVVGGHDAALDGPSDAFVARLDPWGGSVLDSGYLGGALEERAEALALDRHGAAWVVGSRGAHAFVIQTSLDTRGIARDATLAGERVDAASGVVVDGNGDARVAGLTLSPDLVDAGRPAATRGGDVFVTGVRTGEPAPLGSCPSGKMFLGIQDNTWENANNWTNAILPQATDDVCIQGFHVVAGGGFQNAGTLRVEGGSLTIAGAQLTVAGASEITGTLALQSGTLTGAGNITVSGPFSWTGGTLSGSGITTTNGATSIGGTASKGLFAHRWDVNGPVTWTGTGTVSISSGAVINNASVWDCQNDVALIWAVGAATAFNNTGTFTKSAGTGTTSVQAPFYNTGSVLIQTGSMNFTWGGSSTGSFDLGVSHTLQFGGSTFNVDAGTTFSGSGNILLSTSTLSVNAAIAVPAAITFDMTGGILTGTGTLTTAGTFNFLGGTMQSSGITTCNGPLNIGGTVAKGIQQSRILNNNATCNYTATGAGNLGVSTAAVINNPGTWDFQGDGSVVWGVGTAPSFNNTGTLKKSSGAGTSNLQLPFVNTGTVMVQTGTLNSNQGGSSTGVFDIAAGTTLQFGGGTFQVDAGTTFSGSGTILLSTSTLSVNAAIGVPATLPFDMTGGILTGTGTLTTAGALNFSGGTMQSAGVTTCNGPLNISGASAKGIQQSRTVNNNATAVFTSTANLGVSTAAVIHNSGTWDFQGDGAIVWGVGSAPAFNNHGTLKKSAGSGTTFLQLPFNNDGSVLVQSGTLNSNQGGANTGSFAISAGTTLQWGGGTYNLDAGTAFTGSGTILLSAAALNVNDAVSTPPTTTFSMTGGSINGTGTLTTGGTFNWSAGTFNSAGITNFAGPLNVSGSGSKGVASRVLNNNFLATWTGAATLGMSYAAVINNNGTWECLNDAAISWGVGAAPSFNNLGTFRKSASAGTTQLLLPYRNQGTVEVQSGIISTSNYSQTAGTTRLTGGAFASTTTIAIQGGTLAGSGTVTGPVVVSGTGALAPGLSPGALALSGTYTQQAPDTGFDVEIGGTSPSQYDRASVTGTTTLAGNLRVTLIDGFVPVPGDSFAVLTYPSRTGTYTPSVPSTGCIGWRIAYGSAALVLTAEAVPQEITALTMTSKTAFSWAAAAAYANTTYNVLRGDLDTLPVGPGADETCVVPSTTGTTGSDATTPNPGKGFWYLVRETVAGCGAGTYGFASGGAERISIACP